MPRKKTAQKVVAKAPTKKALVGLKKLTRPNTSFQPVLPSAKRKNPAGRTRVGVTKRHAAKQPKPRFLVVSWAAQPLATVHSVAEISPALRELGRRGDVLLIDCDRVLHMTSQGAWAALKALHYDQLPTSGGGGGGAVKHHPVEVMEKRVDRDPEPRLVERHLEPMTSAPPTPGFDAPPPSPPELADDGPF